MNVAARAERASDGIHARDRRRARADSDEYELLVTALGREPNLTELGIFSVMWSEHCSYKSSKVWLKKLPTEARR